MIGGAVLNAAAFTGGNYLAKYLAADSGQAALAEKTRHDKALEAYQAAMAKYTRERTQLRALTGLKQTEKSKLRRIKTSRTPITRSSYTIRRTPTINCRCPKSRCSQTCISQVTCRNKASFFLSVVEHSRLVTLLFVSFELFLHINKWMSSSPKSTTAPRVTGKAPLQSKN